MAFLTEMDSQTGFIEPNAALRHGAELQPSYQAAIPFPHIVIDNFLPPSLINTCIAEFSIHADLGGASYNREHERLKREIKPESMSPTLRSLFYSFNSLPFIKVIENITGIKGLVPDPYFLGAGFHEIRNGGHLSVHADFNHHKAMNLERRVNVLIYLNPDWSEEYGGQLELWDAAMTKCHLSVVPALNRCVIFSTTSESNHGNPAPVNHPSGATRKSIALYYYTSTWDDTKKSHTTRFSVRPGSDDKTDWAVRLPALLKDFIPPIAQRALSRARQREA